MTGIGYCSVADGRPKQILLLLCTTITSATTTSWCMTGNGCRGTAGGGCLSKRIVNMSYLATTVMQEQE
jgi:hypothetical protein